MSDITTPGCRTARDPGVIHIFFATKLDYYRKKSTDLLANDAIDPTMGFTSLTRNVGAITNDGVEITVDATPIRNKDFSWNLVYNLALNHNKVNSYNVTRNYASSYATANGIHVAGYPANGLWGYRFAGLNDKGETQIYDADNNIGEF